MSNLTHFVLNHFGPASTTVQGDPFLVKELLNAVDLEFSECFRMHHPDNEKNLPVIRAFSHGNLVERMKNRKKTGLNREVQAVHYPCISVTRGARVEGFVEVRAIGSEEGESSRVSPVARDKSRAVSTALNDCKSNRKSSKKSRQRNPNEDAPSQVAPNLQFKEVFALGMEPSARGARQRTAQTFLFKAGDASSMVSIKEKEKFG